MRSNSLKSWKPRWPKQPLRADCATDDMSADLCTADLNGDGTADGADLAILLGGWGACP